MEAEAAIRLTIFLSVFAVLALCEQISPFRKNQKRAIRWPSNIGLSALNTLLIRLAGVLVPSLSLGAAVIGEGDGLLRQLGLGGVAATGVGFVLLDLAIYAQHRLMHSVPMLWRLHRVHHADLEFDVTTSVRFHPVEMLVSLAWKIVVVMVLGVPFIAVLIFEIVLNAGSMFNHANIGLPMNVERVLRYFIVTPGMHRIHHSVLGDEVNSNYGFNFSLWDRIFGTYRPQALSEQATMMIGLPGYRAPETAQIVWLLLFPFRRGHAF